MSIMGKSVATALAAATLVSGVCATTTPAAAWYRHGGWGAPVAAGVIGGFAAGAILGGMRSAAYGYGVPPVGVYAPAYVEVPTYGYEPLPAPPPCYRGQMPVYDAYGTYVGSRVLRMCN